MTFLEPTLLSMRKFNPNEKYPNSTKLKNEKTRV